MLTIHVWPKRLKEFLLTHPLYKSPFFSFTPISRLARPSPPPRAARQDLPVLLKPANHTLAFRRGISAESSFVNAKHFQPRSFSDAPTRYKVLSSITRNLRAWNGICRVMVLPPSLQVTVNRAFRFYLFLWRCAFMRLSYLCFDIFLRLFFLMEPIVLLLWILSILENDLV